MLHYLFNTPDASLRADANVKQASTSTIRTPQSFSWGTPKQAIIVAASVFTIVIILGFLHIVRHADGALRAVVAKEHFTYSMTFVCLEDLITRSNNRGIAEAQRGDPLFDHLIAQLEQKKVISTHKLTWREIGEKVRKDLPDE